MGGFQRVVIRWIVIGGLAFGVWAVLPGGLRFQLRVWELERALVPMQADFPHVSVSFLTNRYADSVRYRGEVASEVERVRLIEGLRRSFADDAAWLCAKIRISPMDAASKDSK